VFGWHVPCCEVLDFSLNGSRMFTGVSRMECKALATQLALMRWQLRQQPWTSRGSDEAHSVRRTIDDVHITHTSSNSSSGVSNPDQNSPTGMQQEMNIVQQDPTHSVRVTEAPQGTAARDQPHSGYQPQPVEQPLTGSNRRAAGTVQWVKAAAAPVARRPLPSLAQLHAERVRDQLTRDTLKGSILRGCGCCAYLPGIDPGIRSRLENNP